MDLIGAVDLPEKGTLQLWNANRQDHFMPGQVFSGCVKFMSSKPLFIRGIWVKLTGWNTLTSDECSNDLLQKVDLFAGEDDHYLGGVHDVLLGFGEEDEAEAAAHTGDAMLQLPQGNHEWNFTFKIPSNAPFSYCDKNAEILYTATAFADIAEVPIALSQISQNIIIGCPSDQQPVPTGSTNGVLIPEGVLGNNQKEIVSFMPRQGIFRVFRSAADSAETAATRMKLTVPSGGRMSAAVFNFEFVRTFLTVRCTLETDRIGKPLRIEARLLTCVNMRKNPTKPFRTIQKLLESADATKSSNKKDRMTVKKGFTEGGFCHTIWKSSMILDSTERINNIDFEVPICIDPSFRTSCLSEWPRPDPLPHQLSDAILNFTTDGPLFEYKVLLVVSIKKGGKSNLLFPPCIGEVLIRPPARVLTPQSVGPVPGVTPCVGGEVAASIQPRTHNERDRRGRRPRLPLSTSTGHTRLASERGIGVHQGISGRSNTIPLEPLNSMPHIRVPAVTVAAHIVDENIPPNVNGSQTVIPGHTRSTRTKVARPLTPYATISIPKVMGEAVSRGPAAVLQDRTNVHNRNVQITPSRFAPAYEVGIGAVVIFDATSTLAAPLTPPAYRGCATQEYSPAMAFLCSANTSRLLGEQDDRSPYNTHVSPSEPTLNDGRRKSSRRRVTDARRLSFSRIMEAADTRGADDVEELNRSNFSSYNQSPPPLILTSRPHSHSVSSMRPLIINL